MIYNENFERLEKVFGNMTELMNPETHGKLKSGGFMDLVYEVQGDILCLSHYFEQNGDLVPGPDMTVRINLEQKTAEALTFQNQFTFSEVYPEPTKINPRMKRSLNDFLSMWLTNIVDQGFKLTEKVENAG